MFDRGRRDFITKTGLLTLSTILPWQSMDGLTFPNRKFKLSLNPGAIGVELSQLELLQKAIEYGFEAIVPFPNQLAVMRDEQLSEILEMMSENKISWGAANLPLDFRGGVFQYKEELARLIDGIDAMRWAGAKRMSTWIMPTHDTLTYRKNFNLHLSRLREVGDILSQNNIKLGLEYVGPQTLMTAKKYPFIHTMEECLELISAIDRSNVGIQLDAFHWYCAGESKEDLLNLDPKSIITVDLNDAKTGRTRAEQLDWERELPADTGVVDIKSFLTALVEIGYTGPVRAEPFNKELNKLETDQALRKTMNAMKNAVSKMY